MKEYQKNEIVNPNNRKIYYVKFDMEPVTGIVKGKNLITTYNDGFVSKKEFFNNDVLIREICYTRLKYTNLDSGKKDLLDTTGVSQERKWTLDGQLLYSKKVVGDLDVSSNKWERKEWYNNGQLRCNLKIEPSYINGKYWYENGSVHKEVSTTYYSNEELGIPSSRPLSRKKETIRKVWDNNEQLIEEVVLFHKYDPFDVCRDGMRIKSWGENGDLTVKEYFCHFNYINIFEDKYYGDEKMENTKFTNKNYPNL